ncbi:discoidin domain-containing protein [Plebeiibacterium sediminum]|uniref:Discoidin domain-containing protein n=1 Tax=Plebeiibacterium sediminum TaxID=2992112 RepID=A0AAE3M5A3_9BACT|nr:discoidin domain-containing protein [Plebeiobacterium sediminum]MCW3787092.1 discoidin domain-containing protein [Plebeiobacterium sediminum]
MKKTGVFFILLVGLLFNYCLLKGEKIEVYSQLNYYTTEENITLNFDFISNPIYTSLKILNLSEELVKQSIQGDKFKVSFPSKKIPLGNTTLQIQLLSEDSTKDTSIVITKLASKANEVKINQETGGLIVEGLPFFPFGFYCGTVGNLPEQEVAGGFNLIGPYQSNMPEGLPERRAYMDRCAELGVKVQYGVNGLIGGGHNGAKVAMSQEERFEILKKEVLEFKDHPALLSWYINDEPAGQGRPASLMEQTYNMIRELDPYHPISMVFMMPSKAVNYRKGMDIAMTDPYPIPKSVTEVQGYVRDLNQTLRHDKSIWMVPQAFGGQEMWPREPTPKEIRTMTYLGLIEGIQGVQYFIHPGLNLNPQSVAAWSECRNMAAEFQQMTPFILDYSEVKMLSSSDENVLIKQFTYKGDRLIVAVNTANKPLNYNFKTDIAEGKKVALWFEYREVISSKGEIADMIDALSTRVYLIRKDPSVLDNKKGNLIYNAGFENVETPGLSSGHNMSFSNHKKGDHGATVFNDSRTSKEGLFSLRMVTPQVGAGKKVFFTPVAITKGATYRFSIWAKAKEQDEMPSFNIGIKALKKSQNFTLTSDWQEYSFLVQSDSSSTNTIVELDLSDKGTAWFDEISLSQEPYISYEVNPEDNTAKVRIATSIPETTIKYAFEGKSGLKTYKKPFVVDESLTVQAMVYQQKKAIAESSLFIPINKALNKKVLFETALSSAYPSQGASSVTDGIMGSTVFKDGNWLGFTTSDVTFTIDMGVRTEINSITPHFLSDANSGIFLPKEIEVQFSDDGKNYMDIETYTNQSVSKRGEPYLVPMEIKCNKQARFVKLKIKTFGKIPEGYLFKGTDSWMFMDEVMIK